MRPTGIAKGVAALVVVISLLAGPGVAQVQSAVPEVESPEVLEARIDALHSAGKLSEAVPLAERALAIRERRLGPDHPDVGLLLNSLGYFYRSEGRLSDAEPLYIRALRILENAGGVDHPDVAVVLNNLGGLNRLLGRFKIAESHLVRALAIVERVFGPNDTRVAATLDNLGILYQSQENAAAAVPLHLRALRIREAASPGNDPGLTVSLGALADAYAMQGKAAEAEPIYKRTISVLEAAWGMEHPQVGTALAALAAFFIQRGRMTEGEALLLRAITIQEKALGPQHIAITGPLEHLAQLYITQGQHGKAEQALNRLLALRSRVLGPEHSSTGMVLNDLAVVALNQGRFVDSDRLFKQALAISEKMLGPDHPSTAATVLNIARLRYQNGADAEAGQLVAQAMSIFERTLGPHHFQLATGYAAQARLALERRDFALSAEYWRRSASIEGQRLRLALDGTASGLSAGKTSRSTLSSVASVKTSFRSANGNETELARLSDEVLDAVMWSRETGTAAALSQMAVRSASGSPQLARLIRERQDLVSDWSMNDTALVAARSEPAAKRSAASEKVLSERVATIDARIADIDKQLASEFPDYVALTRPGRIEVSGLQASLRNNEALVVFLDTSALAPLPEETFVWVVTKGEVRWLRSPLGTEALKREVAALRCGLDATAWWSESSACRRLVGVQYTEQDHSAGKPLPFDLARAHALYKNLLGEAEPLIKGKHLLVVPSGALTTLPFQVLVTKLPEGASAGETTREIGRLGAELGPLKDEDRAHLPAGASGGVLVVKVQTGSPAEAAALQNGDVLLALDGRPLATVPSAIATVQNAGPGRAVTLSIVRAEQRLELPVVLGSGIAKGWKPLFVDDSHAQGAQWLIRDHAITVLPSVSSLSSLRRTARPSAATKPLIGFGNPLLDGDQGEAHKELAKMAREQVGCAAAPAMRTAALRAARRSPAPIPQNAGLADLAHLRMQSPLPETADELCDVARAVGADTGDVRIGKSATESEIKRLSSNGELAHHRILHFATHGFLAGQISGTREPGLIMTPPDSATDGDDGYLSGSEIAALKLDADWVILSACNTAGAGGMGEEAEALSGLARVFFYAGARALLVSHWEVDSVATVKLITTAIGNMANDNSLGRAEAMRRAMLAVMADKSRPATWIPAWHPAIWAPFAVVGEGAAGVAAN